MPYGRLDDKANGNAKLLALTDPAWRLWGCGLIYCQDNLTDGFIPDHAIHAFGVRFKNKEALAEELCRSLVPGKGPLWHRVADGYTVHDYFDWNDSKADILKMRAEGKERLAAWRQRKRDEQEALQATLRNALQTPLPEGLQRANPVVRGSGDLKEEKEVARFSGKHQTAGVMAGALPRDHQKHSACSPTFSHCVPEAVHSKLLNKLAPKHGGDRAAAAIALGAWYETVWASLAADFVMGDEFKFWQGRFDAAFASKDPAAKGRSDEAKSTVPTADRTAAYLKSQRQA